MSAAWKDVSSWSRSTTKEERAVPKAWQLVVGNGDMTVLVHRHRDHGPDVWLLTCYEARLECRVLSSADADAAKVEAARTVMFVLSHRVDGLRPFAELTGEPVVQP